MKCLILGDVHGFWADMNITINRALLAHPDITHIIQVGDFGYGWGGKPFKFSNSYFNHEQRALLENIECMWLDGNHENFDKLDNDGGILQPGWKHMPRGSVVEIDGYRLMFFGGASSIDRANRTEGVSWWRQENITYSQVCKALEEANGPIDALFSHEHALCVPYSDNKYKTEDMPSKSNRQLLQGLVDGLKPKFHFFGHHHAGDCGNVGDMQWVCCPIIEDRTYTIWNGYSIDCSWWH